MSNKNKQRNRQQQGMSVLNRLDPQTLTNLYMQSVNQNPTLHPTVTQGNVSIDTICLDFVSWCAGLVDGVKNYQQISGQSPQQFGSGFNFQQQPQQRGQQGRQPLVFPGQQQQTSQVNINSLPSTIRTALQSIVSNYGGGQRRTA